MKNRLQDARDHLFATLEGLLDEDKPMELDRARAVADVAQVIVNSAKVEVDAMRVLSDAGVDVKPSVFLVGETRLIGQG